MSCFNKLNFKMNSYAIKHNFLFKILLFLEILPFFMCYEEFIHNYYNSVSSLIFYLSQAFWARSIEKYICNKLVMDITINEYEDIINEKKYSPEYFFTIYDESSNIFFSFFLILAIMFLICFLYLLCDQNNYEFMNNFLTKFINLILRHFSFLLYYLVFSRIFTLSYFSFDTNITHIIIYILILISIFILSLVLIKINISFINYPYDFEIVDMEIIFNTNKILCALMYNLEKFNNGNFKKFTTFIFILLNFAILIKFFLKLNFIIKINHKYNFYRFTLFYGLNLFLLFKIFKSIFSIYELFYSNLFLMIYFSIFFSSIKYFHNLIFREVILTNDNYVIEFIFYANKYLYFMSLPKTQDYYKKNLEDEFKKKFALQFYLHKYCKECDDHCLICKNQFHLESNNLLIFHEINAITYSIFSNFLKNYKINNIYHKLLRIQSLIIVSNTSNFNSNLFLFEIHRNLNMNSLPYFFKSYCEYLLKTLFINEALKEDSSILYKILEFYRINKKISKVITLIKQCSKIIINEINYLTFTQLIKLSNQIRKMKKKIKTKIEVSLINEKENFKCFLVCYYYKVIFNKDILKFYRVEDNIELQYIEECLEKLTYIILYFDDEKNDLIIKTINKKFSHEFQYENEELYNKSLSTIFPEYIKKIQINQIINQVINNTKEKDSFVLKLLSSNKNENLKFVKFFFKTVVDLKLKIYLICEISKLNKKNISKKSSIFTINENGQVIHTCENSLKMNLPIVHSNIFDFLKINKNDLMIDTNFFQKKSLSFNIGNNEMLALKLFHEIIFWNKCFYILELTRIINDSSKKKNQKLS